MVIFNSRIDINNVVENSGSLGLDYYTHCVHNDSTLMFGILVYTYSIRIETIELSIWARSSPPDDLRSMHAFNAADNIHVLHQTCPASCSAKVNQIAAGGVWLKHILLFNTTIIVGL